MPPTAVTIGTFDGVHLGHRALLAEARRAVGADGRVVVLSFDPHPLAVLRPGRAPARLGTFEQRAARLREAGADLVERLDPAGGVLGLTAEAFVDRLVAEHGPSVVVEGPDFRFGRGRAGTVESLRSAGRTRGFSVIEVGPVSRPLTNGQLVPVRSTWVRRLVTAGRMSDVAALLGRPHDLVARVVSGDRRGRTIGVPTANLDHGDRLLPADGVYAGVATDPHGGRHAAAINVGTNPTFDGPAHRRCEVHLVDWSGPVDVYDWSIHVQFVRWLRGPVRFDGPDALVAQIRRDVARVRRLMDPASAAAPNTIRLPDGPPDGADPTSPGPAHSGAADGASA